jgi:hypothetical protein
MTVDVNDSVDFADYCLAIREIDLINFLINQK